jgi:transcriptional regulator with XRE-family HTH domain
VKRAKSEKSKKYISQTKEKIKRRMDELEQHTGFSQSDIAVALDVRVQYVNDIYHGKVDMQGSTIQRIAREVYGMEDYEFLQEGYFPEHIKVKKPYPKPKRKKNEEKH